MSRTCLITGAASGLGRAFALLFSQKSYDLILVDKDRKNLETVQQEIVQVSGQVSWIIHQDLSIPGSAQIVYENIKSRGFSVDVLINNAGFGIFGLFSAVSFEAITNLVGLSVVTTSQLTRLFLPEMIEARWGRILFVSSLAAFQPAPVMSVYAASKAYLLYLGEALANETRHTGVTVTVLCPGMIHTNFQQTTGNKEPQIRWNISRVEQVARVGYRALMKGKTLAIPGVFNQIIARLYRFFPRRIFPSLVRKIHEKNRLS
jgi:uncharacterized protein